MLGKGKGHTVSNIINLNIVTLVWGLPIPLQECMVIGSLKLLGRFTVMTNLEKSSKSTTMWWLMLVASGVFGWLGLGSLLLFLATIVFVLMLMGFMLMFNVCWLWVRFCIWPTIFPLSSWSYLTMLRRSLTIGLVTLLLWARATLLFVA